MIKVSFIVPIYNVDAYVSACVESLVNQEYKNVEIILVDDGSDDNSYDICKKYASIYSNIKLLHQENKGANCARNLGLSVASGEWVCFIDGDDYAEPNICSALEEDLKRDWDIIIYSYNKVCNGQKQAVKSTEDRLEFHKEDFSAFQRVTLNRLRKEKYNYKILDTVSVWNKFYRKEFLQKNNLKFIDGMPKLQDLTFNLQVYDYAQSAVFINIPLYNYRINMNSVSHRYQPDIIGKFEIINKYIAQYVKEHADEEMLRAYYERIVTHARTIVVLDLCNEKNKKNYKTRKKDFINLIRRKPYSRALKLAELKNFTFKERILSWAIKNKLFLVCEGLNMMERFEKIFKAKVLSRKGEKEG